MKQTDIMNVILKPIPEITPYENNPRRNAQAVHDVAESIKRYGFQQPLVIDREGVIVVGHTRFLAAKELGLDTVPCVVSQLTGEQNRAYRLVDNKTAEGAAWDFDKLAEELSDISDKIWDDFVFEWPGALQTVQKDMDGAQEINVEDFADERFQHECPKCGFRFND